MIRRGIGVQSFVSAGGGTDADAQAFITAAGITDATQQSAINTLVTDLKTYGVWSKMKAIYPFVGGTSSTHKWNLKDPRDLDAAFRLVFSGGITHSSTGVLFGGVNGYADSFLTPLTTLNASDVSITYYSRTNTTTAGGEDIGAWNSSYSNGLSMGIYRAASSTSKTYAYVINPGTAQGYLNAGNQTSTGLFTANRVSNNNAKMFRNGVSVGTNTNTLTLTRPSFKLYIGAANEFGTAGAFSNKECAFASIGDGLTDTEAANLYTAVQAYQTTLSRNV